MNNNCYKVYKSRVSFYENLCIRVYTYLLLKRKKKGNAPIKISWTEKKTLVSNILGRIIELSHRLLLLYLSKLQYSDMEFSVIPLWIRNESFVVSRETVFRIRFNLCYECRTNCFLFFFISFKTPAETSVRDSFNMGGKRPPNTRQILSGRFLDA